MKPVMFGLFLTLFCTFAFAAEHQKIDTLGISSKGQYVALEEYGYLADTHFYYSRVKIINVWKNEYVGTPVEVSLPAHRPLDLQKARDKVKLLAQDQLKQFNING